MEEMKRYSQRESQIDLKKAIQQQILHGSKAEGAP